LKHKEDSEFLDDLEDFVGTDSSMLPIPAPDPHEYVPAPYTPGGLPVPRDVAADSLKTYLAEVRQYPLLTRAEEDELLKLYSKNHDPELGKRLVTSNLRLVIKIAMEFQSHWLNNLQDLIQEGNIGLLQALKKFDPSRGVKFSYYASYWIKAYILKFIMDNWRLVKVGTTQAQRKLFFNLRKEQERILKEGLEPYPELLAERLGVSQVDVEEMDQRMGTGKEISLDIPLGEDSEDTQGSYLQSTEQRADNLLADSQVRELVADRLSRLRKTLDDRELIILDRRLMQDEPVTLQELGEEFGVSRERVRQLEERLKKKLSAYFLKELPDLEF
jgi:RNA polymerase sigma-32 factor